MEIHPDVAAALARLTAEARTDATVDVAREAAVATGGLPVHCDMGGVLVVTAGGDVNYYDPEHKTTSRVADSRWRTLALVKAARNHPELASLRPAMPVDAMACTSCSGTGRVFEVADCGQCMGTGWLVPTT